MVKYCKTLFFLIGLAICNVSQAESVPVVQTQVDQSYQETESLMRSWYDVIKTRESEHYNLSAEEKEAGRFTMSIEKLSEKSIKVTFASNRYSEKNGFSKKDLVALRFSMNAQSPRTTVVEILPESKIAGKELSKIVRDAQKHIASGKTKQKTPFQLKAVISPNQFGLKFNGMSLPDDSGDEVLNIAFNMMPEEFISSWAIYTESDDDPGVHIESNYFNTSAPSEY